MGSGLEGCGVGKEAEVLCDGGDVNWACLQRQRIDGGDDEMGRSSRQWACAGVLNGGREMEFMD